ncbi:hypothetical protein D9M72_522700 [compost metagenome]
MHAGRVEIAEPRLLGIVLAVDEIEGGRQELAVDRFHALLRQRAGILDPAIGIGVDDAARAEALGKFRALRIIGIFRLLLGIEVVKVAEELVEAVGGRQELVLVAQVVLAELAGGIALRLEQFGNGRVFRLQAEIGAGQADFRQAGADRRLAGDEGGAPGGAALLAIPIGEESTLIADAVDVGRAIAHHAAVIDARIEPADIVAHDHQDVRLAAAGCGCCRLLRVGRRGGNGKGCGGERTAAKQQVATADA